MCERDKSRVRCDRRKQRRNQATQCTRQQRGPAGRGVQGQVTESVRQPGRRRRRVPGGIEARDACSAKGHATPPDCNTRSWMGERRRPRTDEPTHALGSYRREIARLNSITNPGPMWLRIPTNADKEDRAQGRFARALRRETSITAEQLQFIMKAAPLYHQMVVVQWLGRVARAEATDDERSPGPCCDSGKY